MSGAGSHRPGFTDMDTDSSSDTGTEREVTPAVPEGTQQDGPAPAAEGAHGAPHPPRRRQRDNTLRIVNGR